MLIKVIETKKDDDGGAEKEEKAHKQAKNPNEQRCPIESG